MRKRSVVIAIIFALLIGSIGFATQFRNEPVEITVPEQDVKNPNELSGYYAQQLDWNNCGGGFECSTLTVPLNYDDPYNDAIGISVIRLKAKNNTLGSLVLNPGGPGGSGIQYTRAAQWVVSEQIRENYDIVGFDPRGVGESTPIECLDDKETDFYVALDGTPDNQAEIDETVKFLTSFGKDCIDNSSALINYVDTVSAAKDIDILRASLGSEKLNWLGKSYGTFLGATYADLFPTFVGRMLLDGAIDPALSNLDISEGQARGFEDALVRFSQDCILRSECPFSGSAQDGVKQIQKLFDDLDQNPATLDDGRAFTQAMGVLGVVGGLYDVTYGWTNLRIMLGDAFAGDFNSLAESVDLYTSRNQDGTYGDNSNDAIVAVNCIDRADRSTVAETIELAEKWTESYPVFGGYLAWSNISCSYYPIAATGVAHKIFAEGSNQILVVGTAHDPATPYDWAVALADQLENSALLTLDGDGHTAYMQGSKCIDEVVDKYFLTGVVTDGVVCTDGP